MTVVTGRASAILGWSVAAGHNPLWLIGQPYPTGLEVRETIAEGYAGGTALNARSLTIMEYWLRAAWLLFIGSPVPAILAYVARQYLTPQPG